MVHQVPGHMGWMGRLRELLQEALRSGEPIVFVGVGNILRGDDGIGVKIAETLKNSVESDKVRVIIVEDRVDILDRFLGNLKPSLLIFFDAADFGGEPGEIRILSPAEASEKTISTHLIPLDIILRMSEITASSYVIGIQVMTLGFGGDISEPVREAGEIIAKFLKEELVSLMK